MNANPEQLPPDLPVAADPIDELLQYVSPEVAQAELDYEEMNWQQPFWDY